jgi:hypothetical protein
MFSSHWKRVNKKENWKYKKNNQINSKKFRNRLMNQPIKYNLKGNILLTIYYLEWINNVNYNKV